MQVNTKCQSRPIATNLDQSRAQVASEIDGEQRKELEHMILELEAENANLKVEQLNNANVKLAQLKHDDNDQLV